MISKKSFLDKITKKAEQSSKLELSTFICWKQNEMFMLRSNVMSVFAKKRIFPEFSRPTRKNPDVGKVLGIVSWAKFSCFPISLQSLIIVVFLKLNLQRVVNMTPLPAKWNKVLPETRYIRVKRCFYLYEKRSVLVPTNFSKQIHWWCKNQTVTLKRQLKW